VNGKELKELQNIKKLLVLQLLVSGIPANEIARIIDIHPTDFSKMFPARKLLKNVRRNGSKPDIES
jgi:hypothetical protein